jgi:hypothetical protein
MKRITKINKSNNIETIKNDIENIFNKLIKNKHQTYFITYSKFQNKTLKEIKFLIKNNLLNSIWKDNKHSNHIINYLFVIELPETITNPSLKYLEKIDNIDYHVHLIINTSIHELTLEYYINTLIYNDNIDFQNITKRTDINSLFGYLIKQDNYLTNDSYEYKALI